MTPADAAVGRRVRGLFVGLDVASRRGALGAEHICHTESRPYLLADDGRPSGDGRNREPSSARTPKLSVRLPECVQESSIQMPSVSTVKGPSGVSKSLVAPRTVQPKACSVVAVGVEADIDDQAVVGGVTGRGGRIAYRCRPLVCPLRNGCGRR